jgi:hypothetical protein
LPDRDIFSRCAAPGWRTPVKCFYSTAEPAEVACATWRATALALRRHGGLAAPPDLAAIVRDHDEGRVNAIRSLERIRAVQAEYGHDLHVRVAGVTASRMVAEGYAGGGGAFPDAGKHLAARFIHDLIAHHVFERKRPELMAHRFGQDESLRASFEARCWEEIGSGGRIVKVAEQLARDPSGAHVRAPANPHARRLSTDEWLTQTLG